MAAGGSGTKRKAPVLEYDDRPSLAGVGGHWREQMAAGGNGKEPMDIDNTDMIQEAGGKDTDAALEAIGKGETQEDTSSLGHDAHDPSSEMLSIGGRGKPESSKRGTKTKKNMIHARQKGSSATRRPNIQNRTSKSHHVL